MPDQESTNLSIILARLDDIKSDVKTIETKLDSIAVRTERHDARLETLERQQTQFVPASLLDERKAAFERRVAALEVSLADLPKKEEARNSTMWTRGIAIASMLVTLAVGGCSYMKGTIPPASAAPVPVSAPHH